jgi:hypothetical protein
MIELYLSTLGSQVTIIDTAKKLQAFLAKLLIQKKRLGTANFQILEEVLYQDGHTKFAVNFFQRINL